jgi:hypothetical protein
VAVFQAEIPNGRLEAISGPITQYYKYIRGHRALIAPGTLP